MHVEVRLLVKYISEAWGAMCIQQVLDFDRIFKYVFYIVKLMANKKEGFSLVYTDTQNFWVLTRTDTVSLFHECF